MLPDLVPDVPRAVTRHFSEGATEGAKAVPARVERDLADGHLRVPEQRAGPFDAPREQIAMRRQAEGLLELPRKVRCGYVAHLRQARHGPFFIGSLVHAVLRAQQAAKECWILGAHPVCLGFSGSGWRK